MNMKLVIESDCCFNGNQMQSVVGIFPGNGFFYYFELIDLKGISVFLVKFKRYDSVHNPIK